MLKIEEKVKKFIKKPTRQTDGLEFFPWTFLTSREGRKQYLNFPVFGEFRSKEKFFLTFKILIVFVNKKIF